MTLVARREERWCPSCRMRYAVNPPAIAEYHALKLNRGTLRYLKNAARTFDEMTDPQDCWTAEEFLDWLSPDVKEEQ